MKWKARVRHLGDTVVENEWWEKYDKIVDDPYQYMVDCIEKFNDDLRGSKPRELMEVIIEDKSNPKEHDWEKLNVMTIMDKSFGPYDDYKCKRCGIKGYRQRLDQGIIRYKKYRKPEYDYCSG